MAKTQLDAIYDSGTHSYVRVRATRVTVLNAQAGTYSSAYNTSQTTVLARSNVITSTDFTLADGDTSGRKITVAAQSAVSVIRTGTASHVAIVGSTGSTLLMQTTCTTQALTTGNTVNIPAFDFELRDVA